MSASRCTSCGAAIVWARTDTGRSMPLDPDPVEGGNVQLGADGVARVVGPLFGGTHKSHFATCPQAAQHRRKP